MVITAAHCLYGYRPGDQTWHTNVLFVPGTCDTAKEGYAGCPFPNGLWPARVLGVAGDWAHDTDWAFDVGMLVVDPPGPGIAPLTEVVGGQGLTANWGTEQDVWSFGYPALLGAPNQPPSGGGQWLMYCNGRTAPDPDPWPLPFTEGTLSLPCDMLDGASGGPWLLGFNGTSGLGFVNSVTSGGNDVAPWVASGPYFGQPVMDLYDALAAR